MKAPRWRLRTAVSLGTCVVAATALLLTATSAVASNQAANFLAPFSVSGSGAPPGYTPSGPPPPSHQPRYPGKPGAPNPWMSLTHAPPLVPGSMNLMTDGSVLVHQDNSGQWARLVPDATGSYVNGTWQNVASMPAGYTPLYYASQILPSGQLIISGGEYNGGGTEVWTTQGAIYNPNTNAWTTFNAPSSWAQMGDAQSVMLPTGSGNVYTSGQMMIAHPFGDSSDSSSTDAALLTGSSLGYNWSVIAGNGKLDRNDEEGWSLLSNNRVLAVDIENNWNGVQGGSCSPCTSELYNPATKTWSATGNVPVDLPSYVGPNGPSEEMGPVVTRPNGQAFAIGGNDATATYTPSSGTWTAGPTLPNNYDSADGSASVLPNGNVLFDASPGVFNAPTHFYVWNGSTITQVADTKNASGDSTYTTRMLVLPTGQVMFTDGTGDIEIFNAEQTFNDSWRPVINSVSSSTLTRGTTYSLTGLQCSGRDTGAAYGDDNQSSTNYPLVRLTQVITGDVWYARTNAFSYETDKASNCSTKFTVPRNMATGEFNIQMVANGIPSFADGVTIN